MFRSLGRLANRSETVQTAIRSFAAEAAPADVKVPTAVFGVAGKYASALYVSAVRGGKVDAVEREMRELAAVTGANPTFASFLRDPSVSREVRVKAVEDIFSQAKYSPLTKNFLGERVCGGWGGWTGQGCHFIPQPLLPSSPSSLSPLSSISSLCKVDVSPSPFPTPPSLYGAAVLAEAGRLSYLPKIAATYEDILMAHRGQVKATVTAALVSRIASLAAFPFLAAGCCPDGDLHAS
ncbi:unnamed protein product [Closterium sp. NIES-54]